MSQSDERSLRWIVRGRVQGVYYRYFTRQEAHRLGLAGWVRNLPDGTVEAHVQGPAEKVETLRRRLREGPPAARVAEIAEEELPPGSALPRSFEIRY